MQRIHSIENDLTVAAPDGTNIAYAVAGKGPALVLTNGLTTSSFFWQYLRPAWLERHTVITWDLPGHGRSGPAVSPATATIAGQPGVIASVLAAAGVERATQIGWSVGCQVVLELVRQRPELCNGVVTLFGPAEHALRNTGLPIPGSWLSTLLGHRRGTSFASLVQHAAQLATLPGAAVLLRASGLVGREASTADLNHLVTDLGRMDTHTGRALAVSADAHSAMSVLSSLPVPLLVMAGGKDAFAPADRVGARTHAAAPGSEFICLPNATHTALLDHAPEVARAIDDFIARRISAH